MILISSCKKVNFKLNSIHVRLVIFFFYLGIGEAEENCKAVCFVIPAKKKFGCGHYFSNWLDMQIVLVNKWQTVFEKQQLVILL